MLSYWQPRSCMIFRVGRGRPQSLNRDEGLLNHLPSRSNQSRRGGGRREFAGLGLARRRSVRSRHVRARVRPTPCGTQPADHRLMVKLGSTIRARLSSSWCATRARLRPGRRAAALRRADLLKASDAAFYSCAPHGRRHLGAPPAGGTIVRMTKGIDSFGLHFSVFSSGASPEQKPELKTEN